METVLATLPSVPSQANTVALVETYALFALQTATALMMVLPFLAELVGPLRPAAPPRRTAPPSVWTAQPMLIFAVTVSLPGKCGAIPSRLSTASLLRRLAKSVQPTLTALVRV